MFYLESLCGLFFFMEVLGGAGGGSKMSSCYKKVACVALGCMCFGVVFYIVVIIVGAISIFQVK